MIPAEAVEAAVDALVASKLGDHLGINGEEFAEAAIAALEAAAPHMLAAVWDEGAKAGFDVTREGFNGECVFMHCADDDYPPANPYSGEKWTLDDAR